MPGLLMPADIDFSPDCPSSQTVWEAPDFNGGEIHDQSLTVASFNIAHAKNGIGQIVDFIETNDVDVINLQEATDTNVADLQSELATHYDASHGPNITNNELGRFGNYTLSRLPIIDSENYELPTSWNQEDRGLLVTTILPDGPISEPLVVANTHLTQDYPGVFGRNHDAARATQAMYITSVLQMYEQEYPDIVLGGDINEENYAAASYILGHVMQNVIPAKIPAPSTHPSTGRAIDKIYLSRELPEGNRNLIPQSVQIAGGGSDHCGIITTFVLKNTLQEPY